MPTTPSDRELRERVDAFVDDLSELIRRAALEAVQEALGSEDVAVSRGPGRPPKATREVAGPTSSFAGKRLRRTAADLEALATDVLEFVRELPGEGVEAISRGIGVASKELKRPIQQLLAEGRLRTEGQRRGTTYHVGRGSASAPARRKTRRKSTGRTTKAAGREASAKTRRKATKRKTG